MSRTYEISFKLGAKMAADFARTMKSAGGSLNQLNGRLGEIGKQQSSVNNLMKLRNEVAVSSREYTQARQRVAELGRAISNTSNPSKQMTRDFERAKREASQAKERLSQKRQTLRDLDRQMGTTGQSTAQLRRRQEELARSAETARRAQAGLQDALAAQQANLQKRSQLRGQLFDAVALGATLAAPIRTAANFEQAMAKVGAVSRASEDDMKQLTKTARDLGAQTNWSASQAAAGMEYLSMAGFNAQQTVAAMPGMLDLASAGAVDLGQAADIASNILSGFNMQAEEMGRLGDVLTNTFTSSNTNLEMLGNTMAYVAPVAAATGQSIEQTAAMAGKLGDAGIQGSKAGTALRAVINRLAAPTGKAATALEELGIQTQDANGNMRPVPEILADMDAAMRGMGSAARAEMTSAVFGMEAASAATVLLGQAGSGSLQEYAEALKESGSAARVAAEQNDTAMGALKRLGSATESMGITIGGILLPPLATLAELMSKVVGVIDSAAQRFPLLTKVVVTGTAALIAMRIAAIGGGYAFTFVRGAWLAGVVALKKLQVALVLHTATMNTANAGMMTTAKAVLPKLTAGIKAFGLALLKTPIGWFAAAVVGIAAIVWKYWEPIKAFLGGFWDGFREAIKPVITSIQPLVSALAPLGEMFLWVGSIVSSVISWFARLFKRNEYTEESLQNTAAAGQRFGQIFGQVFNALTFPIRMFFSLIGGIYGAVSSAVSRTMAAWSSFKDRFGGTAKAIVDVATAAFRMFNPLAIVRDGFSRLLNFADRFSLFSSGSKIMQTMASGIRSAIGAPARAVQGALSRVRNLLPFSDAKEGPLSQLTASGAAIMKTLSEGMTKAGPADMIGSMASAMRDLLSSVDAGIDLSSMRSAIGRATGGGQQSGSQITMQVTQHITIGAGTGADVQQQARQGASQGAEDLLKKLQEAQQRERRLSYA